MGDFFDKMREAKSEFNALDKAVVLSIGKALFEDPASLRQLWPDAEPVMEGATMKTLLELAYDRENAAKGRDAAKAAAFFSFVVDALVKTIEQAAAEQS